jgi:hypothetical protein
MPPMAWSRPAVVVAGFILLALVADVAVARAQDPAADLRAAEKAFEGLRYEDAVRLCERAYRAGGLAPAELGRLFRLQGEVAATLGREEQARDAFARWLAVVPGATLAAGTSPKLSAPFEQARGQLGGRQLAATWRAGDDGASLLVTVEDDPLSMAAATRATYRDAEGVRGTVEARGPGGVELRLPLPTRGRFQVVVAVLDERGHRLLELGVTEPIFVGEAMSAPVVIEKPRADAAGPSFWTNPWTWTGGALLIGGVAGGFAWRAGEAQDELDQLNENSAEHDFSEALSVEDRLRRDALIANVGFGAAGACAIAALVLWLRPTPGTAVTPLAGRGNLGAVWTWQY